MTKNFSHSKKILSIVLAVVMLVGCVFTTAFSATAIDDSATSTGAGSIDPVFSWDNASVYFLLTDRFYNGDTSNDHSYGRGQNQSGGNVNYDKAAAFQGGDFKGITKKINDGYFTDLGVNAIWLSAPYEQIHGYVVGSDGNPSFAHYSYHGYYVLDYTESDKNFGSKADFKELVDTAHENGIRIVMDVVINHSGYNSLKDMSEFGFGAINSGWENYYYGHNNITNQQYHSYINYNGSASDWGKWWGSDWIRAGLPGYTNGDGSDKRGNLAGLPDFKTESGSQVGIPTFLQNKWKNEGTYNQKISEYGSSNTVNGYLTDWLAEWVREFGVDGFRCDTAKHVEFSEWKVLKNKCVSALDEWKASNPSKALDNLDFWMVGEDFGHKVGKSGYFTAGGFDSMINFEFAPAAGNSSIPGAGSVEGIYSRYAREINNDPNFNALSYISSHDTVLAGGDRKYAGSFMLMLPGGIQIYYGDETNRPTINIPPGSTQGAGHQLRSFMNWDNKDQGVLDHWQKVGSFRNNHIAVGAGEHRQISSNGSATGYTFSRTYDKNGVTDGIVATLFAQANKTIDIDVSSVFSNGTTVTNAYDGTTATVTNGKASFNTGSNGTVLIEGPQSSISLSLKGATTFEGSQEVTVNLKGADFAMASIDGATAFKVQNGSKFTIGENTALGGTVTVELSASNAEDSVSKSYTFKKKDPNAVIKVYFDNSSYNWSSVNAYVYDESSGSAKELAAWPGKAMTKDSATGYYVIEIPDDLADNGQVIFAESTSSANRYPADKQPGMKIEGSSKLFSAGNTWADYSNPTAPTNPPTPTTPPVGSTYTLGDVTGDNKVTLADALAMQDHVSGRFALTGDRLAAAKITGSANVTVTDILAIRQFLAKMDVPYEIGNKKPTTEPTQPTQPTTQAPTQAPTTAPASDERTITLTDTSWSEVTAYYWADGNTPLTWPGTKMSGSNGTFTIVVPNDCNKIIFSQNGGNQTADLSIPGTGNATYKLNAKAWQ